jgi:hypothetical protein
MTDQKTVVAPTEVPRERAAIRRFSTADLSEHGPWIMQRLTQMLPGVDEHWLAGWLRGLIYDNGHLFLYQPHAVCLAQIVTLPSIKPTKVVQERFVWIENKENREQQEAAADFYEDMGLWALNLRIDRMIICENTDVPKADIEKRIGRIFNTTICHVRL